MGLIAALLPLIGGILDRVLPDPVAKAKAMMDLQLALMNSDIAQMDVNKAEAASTNWFVAGWRPAVGWICAMAMFYTYIFLPLGRFVASMISEVWYTRLLNAPVLDENLWIVLTGMLGMGALRSFEKAKDIARNG